MWWNKVKPTQENVTIQVKCNARNCYKWFNLRAMQEIVGRSYIFKWGFSHLTCTNVYQESELKLDSLIKYLGNQGNEVK